ncbi:antitoxin [Microlunatus flavus]|uniref:MT0933-like antitoxin protein n=1 Tax=Microlunatus flavus TaxID=1036181 RepID=A0A1H9JAZ8_9ACTN|nr:antitoxin [Microlunatus flavus]SEQ84201.1 MT0933-like antitoxin protein [Microlunatus flavus]
MGIFDKARDALQQHADKIDGVVDRVAEEADRRTGGQHGAQIDKGAALAKDKLGDYARRDGAPDAGAPGTGAPESGRPA